MTRNPLITFSIGSLTFKELFAPECQCYILSSPQETSVHFVVILNYIFFEGVDL